MSVKRTMTGMENEFEDEIRKTQSREFERNLASAFSTLYEDGVNEALKYLGQLRSQISEESNTSAHEKLYVMLTHAMLLLRCARFDEAEEMAREVSNRARAFEEECHGENDNCFGPVVVLATNLLAEVSAARGEYAYAVKVLQSAVGVIDSTTHPNFSQSVAFTTFDLVSQYGRKLGYIDLADRLGIHQGYDAPHKVDLWEPPTSLKGPVADDQEQRIAELKSANVEPRTDSPDEISYLESAISLMDEWEETEPYAFEPKLQRLQFLFELLKAKVKLMDFAGLQEALPRQNMYIFKLMELTDEFWEAHRILMDGLFRLSTTIYESITASGENSPALYSIIIGIAEQASVGLLTLCRDSPVTATIALNTAALESYLADRYKEVDQFDNAANCNAYYLAILDEMQELDPLNDHAKRLRAFVDPNMPPPSEEIRMEVCNWRWEVAPLIEN